VKVRHLKPQILIPRRGEPGAIVVDPHGKPPRSALTSVAKLWVWLMEEWCAAIFEDERKTIGRSGALSLRGADVGSPGAR
jgi:hypothetical protein